MKPFQSISKWLLLVAIVSSFLFSCSDGKPDDSTTKVQTSSQNKQAFVPIKDAAGNVIGTELKDSIVAVITPTWGQAIYYANASGNTKGHIIAIISLGLFCGAIYALTKVNGPTQTAGVGAFLLLSLGGFIYGWWGKASTVKWNNTKEVPVAQYNEVTKNGWDSRPIWDSLYHANSLVGAASK